MKNADENSIFLDGALLILRKKFFFLKIKS